MIPTSFSFLRVNNPIVIAIPVAEGNTITLFMKFIPIECKIFLTKAHVSWTSNEDPTALGCISFTLPDLIEINILIIFYLYLPMP